MRVAIVGGGISGLGAAYLLSRAHDVQVFEEADRAGGHTRTARRDGLSLDMGFLVHNVPNYPLLTRLFRELGIATQESEMSFSVSCTCGLEYSSSHPFAQRRRIADPRQLLLLGEIARWLRQAARPFRERDGENMTLERYLDVHRYSRRFRRHFLLPMTAALWSTAPGRALDYPAAAAIRFFDNHGMLGFRRFGWRYVTGGCDSYVRAIGDRLGDRLRLGLGVRSIRRGLDDVELTMADGSSHRVDSVVLATHADTTLRLLEDASDEERRVLGAFGYTANETILHTDESQLPAVHAARSSWNYRLGDESRPTVTYYLNRLQRLDSDRHWCVTLNGDIAEEHVVDRTTFDHPRFTVESIAAQRDLPALAGSRRTWYAGAYHGNGFHEDGLASGVAAAEGLGVPW